MILAGFNPTSRPNAAIDFLNHQIDRNLTAQMTNLTAKQNLLTANINQFKNVKDAADMSRIMYNDAASHMIQAAAAKAAGPLAKAAAYDNIGKIQVQNSTLMAGLNARLAIQHLANGNTTAPGSVGHALNQLELYDKDSANSYRSRYYAPFDVPGGKSIADTKEIPKDAMDQLGNYEKFNQLSGELRALITKSQGNINSLNPGERARAAQDSQVLQSLFREGTLGTVYKSGEQPLLDKAIAGQPLDVWNYFTNIPKLDNLTHLNTEQRNILAGQYGLRPPGATPPPPSGSTQQSLKDAQAWAQDPKNANTPKAKQILQRIQQLQGR